MHHFVFRRFLFFRQQELVERVVDGGKLTGFFAVDDVQVLQRRNHRAHATQITMVPGEVAKKASSNLAPLRSFAAFHFLYSGVQVAG